MSKVFPKLAKSITMAAREGGPDPESNSKLRTAILNAKAQNMPKDNIEAAVKRASGKDAADIVEVNYEGKGPHGAMLFVECATDNNNRTVANIKTCFNKGGGQIVPSGALDFLFERKAMFQFPTDGLDMEEVELALMDFGLEELVSADGTAYAYGDYSDFGKLSEGLESLNIETTKASLQRIPTSPIELGDAEMEEVEQLIDRLEDDEDVQAVFTNIA